MLSKQFSFWLASTIFSRFIWIALAGYSFITFFPDFYAPGPGLDPSWVYAISYAAANHLVFGQDIIFTFGPLGYLISGAVLDQNFLAILIFRSFLHVILLIVFLLTIFSIKSNLQKVLLFIGLFVLYLFSDTLEYQVVILFFLLLSNKWVLDSKFIRRWAIGLGSFAGAALLMKFTIGVCTFLALFLFLLANLYQAIQSKKDRENSVLAIVDALISATTTAYIFLNPYPLMGMARIVILLVLAKLSQSIVWFIYSRFTKRSSKQHVHSSIEETPVKQEKLLKDYVFYIGYCLSLVLLVLLSSPSLPRYLQTSLEIASGYSSAMSFIGDSQKLALGISILVLILALLSSGWLEYNRCLSAALMVLVFIIFKHGFVRQDNHILAFFINVPWLIALYIPKIRTSSIRKLAYSIYLYSLIVAIAVAIEVIPHIANPNYLSILLSPTNSINKMYELADPDQYKENLKKVSAQELMKREMPAEVRALVGNKSVDILPGEAAIVPANNLNWKPRPIFQSYAAYTSFLDHANFTSLTKSPRDYIVYSFESIDNRHPFFDEPETWSYIVCNYKIASQFPEYVPLGIPQVTQKILLLEKRANGRCLSKNLEPTVFLPWNAPYALKEKGTINRAAIKFKYSWFGKLYKTLFRASPIRIQVTYVDGSVRNYRVIPENSENGIFISYLPRDNDEALEFLQGEMPLPVKSFKFQASNPLLYESLIELQPINENIAGISSSRKEKIELSNFNNIRFIPNLGASFLGNVDAIQVSKQPDYKGNIIASGWAIRKGTADNVWVLVTVGAENLPLGILRSGQSRPDVAKAFREEKYQKVGWSGILNAERLSSGKHNLKVWIYDPITKTASLLRSEQISIH